MPLPSRSAFMAAQALIHLANNGSHEWDIGELVELNQEEQATLHRWLSELPTPRPRTLKQIAAAIGHLHGKAEAEATVSDGEFHLSLDYRFTAESNLTVVAWMLAAVLQNRGKFASYIRRCPECGIHFFDVPKGRPAKQFCKPAHANAYRQREYRKRKSQ